MQLASESTAKLNVSEFDNSDGENYVGPSARCVLFSSENEIYGIQVKRIREVLRVANIRKVAGAPFTILGVINVRGVIVTVMDARAALNMPAQDVTDYSRIIIVEIDSDNNVVFDAKELETIDTSGLQTLLIIAQSIIKNGKTVSWKNTPEIFSTSAQKIGIDQDLQLQ